MLYIYIQIYTYTERRMRKRDIPLLHFYFASQIYLYRLDNIIIILLSLYLSMNSYCFTF